MGLNYPSVHPRQHLGWYPRKLETILYNFDIFCSSRLFDYLTFAEGQTIKPLDGKYGMEFFIFLYTIYLILAALWMPSTFKVLESGNSNWWFLVQFSLWGVALSTLLMTLGLFMADNISNPSLHKWATLGSVYVTFHCLVLDAWLWTGKFP